MNLMNFLQSTKQNMYAKVCLDQGQSLQLSILECGLSVLKLWKNSADQSSLEDADRD